MQSLKHTTFLEAVAASIQHEKDCFDFYLRMYDEIEDGVVKELFHQLAEDVEDHILVIEEIYQKAEGGKKLPNLKQLAAIHKFHSTAIQKFMKRLDRNTSNSPKGNAVDAIQIALREGEDAKEFYDKMKNKFKDPNIKLLFQRLAYFNEENRALLTSQYSFLKERMHGGESYYWEDEELVKEAAMSGAISQKPKKTSAPIKKKSIGKKKVVVKKKSVAPKKKPKVVAKKTKKK
ncbi:MAG: ferritin family protein [Leptospira sp.]|nr:ferritin family protein [Leptospira sp.]